MIGEINKKKNDYEAAIKYYLRGISSEPSNIENYLDLADICDLLNETHLSRIFFLFAKVISQLNENAALQAVVDDESPFNAQALGELANILEDDEWQELEESIAGLKQRITQRRISSHFLRAINVLQRLIEKYLTEVQNAQGNQNNSTNIINIDGGGEDIERA